MSVEWDFVLNCEIAETVLTFKNINGSESVPTCKSIIAQIARKREGLRID